MNIEAILIMERTKQQLVLNKGIEKFIFRYNKGYEDELLETFIQQVEDENNSFDWFDAAVLSFKLTSVLMNQADQILEENEDMQICMS